MRFHLNGIEKNNVFELNTLRDSTLFCKDIPSLFFSRGNMKNHDFFHEGLFIANKIMK